jgi:CheY-like chemotaxis protein
MESTGFGVGKTVLVVDDHEDFRAATKDLLAILGFRVLCAANGSEALDQLKAERVDVILTDLVMPGMDGVQLILHLQKSREPVPPIIAVTGEAQYAPHKVGDVAAVCGANAVLMKPFSTDQLASAIGFACSSTRRIASTAWSYRIN